MAFIDCPYVNIQPKDTIRYIEAQIVYENKDSDGVTSFNKNGLINRVIMQDQCIWFEYDSYGQWATVRSNRGLIWRKPIFQPYRR